jgi:DNA-binding CsgD family transcriptional regulator
VEPDEIAATDGPAFAAEMAAIREELAWVHREVESGTIPREAVRWSRELAAGMTYEEIAAREGKSVSSVKVAVHRARTVLRTRWRTFVATAAVSVLVVAALVHWLAHRPDAKPSPRDPPSPSSRPPGSGTSR